MSSMAVFSWVALWLFIFFHTSPEYLVLWDESSGSSCLLTPHAWRSSGASILANGCTAFIWKLCCHWLKWFEYRGSLETESVTCWPSLNKTMYTMVLLQAFLANGSTTFIWKLCCHWLKSYFHCMKNFSQWLHNFQMKVVLPLIKIILWYYCKHFSQWQYSFRNESCAATG